MFKNVQSFSVLSLCEKLLCHYRGREIWFELIFMLYLAISKSSLRKNSRSTISSANLSPFDTYYGIRLPRF